LWAWREQFGSDAFWAERLGRLAISSGAKGFWPALTRRRFDGVL
jgi:acyl-CoA dehydrogenase